jgi:hypothetical protein
LLVETATAASGWLAVPAGSGGDFLCHDRLCDGGHGARYSAPCNPAISGHGMFAAEGQRERLNQKLCQIPPPFQDRYVLHTNDDSEEIGSEDLEEQVSDCNEDEEEDHDSSVNRDDG